MKAIHLTNTAPASLPTPFGTPTKGRSDAQNNSDNFEPWAICPGAGWRAWTFVRNFRGVTEMPCA